MAAGYLRVIFVGFLFTFQYNILAAALRSVGDSKTPVIFLAVASVMNAGLDVVFVAFGKWGVIGAGAATVIAEGASALLCAAHIYRNIPLLHLSLRDLRIDKTLLRETVSSGAITALQQACQPIGQGGHPKRHQCAGRQRDCGVQRGQPHRRLCLHSRTEHFIGHHDLYRAEPRRGRA